MAALDGFVSDIGVSTHLKMASTRGSPVEERYLPRLSRDTDERWPAPRVEFKIVDLVTGSAKAFEDAVSADRSRLRGDTL
jgi:hypothetical protein